MALPNADYTDLTLLPWAQQPGVRRKAALYVCAKANDIADATLLLDALDLIGDGRASVGLRTSAHGRKYGMGAA